ncbi:hypothetical protein V7266_07500 [Neobacillus drentensis]|uniref:hypothetical protein n=1 Tax=Neobacillus drentensis TaxID=220684 RepID=UPI003000598A
MNKNELLRYKKIEAIKTAIKEMAAVGALSFPKQEIAKKTETLFKSQGDPDYIVDYRLLSTKFYKENLDIWIKDEVGRNNPNLEAAQKEANKAKKENVKKKYKELEKKAFKIIDMILKGKIKVDKFTRKFLIDEINKQVNNPKYERSYGPTTFSDEKYVQIFHDAHARLIGKVSTEDAGESQKIITALEHSKLKEEFKRLKWKNKALIKKCLLLLKETKNYFPKMTSCIPN